MLSLLLEVISRAVHRGRYLPNLGNDFPLVCSYKVSMRSVLAYSCCNRGWPGFQLRSWAASIFGAWSAAGPNR